MTHNFELRVYYEDTDLAGIVYYANYLRYIERARSEAVRDVGVDQGAMKQDGLVFVVRQVVADYLLPAKFDDVLKVETETTSLKGATMQMFQTVKREDQVIFTADVRIAFMSTEGKPTRVPAIIRQKLLKLQA
ncbi:tol-pal system-associated acyl-CoA thioesterase [Rhodobacterales bacterium 52_120_T64]|nr:tol-pal system-associated acyl-CoA thioesterase [Rhodobacterales bacterium 52_120_T64]